MCSVYSVGVSRETKHAELKLVPDIGLEDQFEPWVNYPATVIRRLVMNFGIDKGD